MTDDTMHGLTMRDRELLARLDAFSTRHLAPDALAVARMRARVMREADHRLAEARRAAPPVAAAIPLRTGTRSASRFAAGILAAVVAVAVAGLSTIATRPGSSLYPVRLWAETIPLAILGTNGAAADLVRLQSRLDEAAAAATAGDATGVQAAMAAYAALLDEAVRAARGDSGRMAELRAAVAVHAATLRELAAATTPGVRRELATGLAKADAAGRQLDSTGPAAPEQGGDGAGGKPTAPGAGPGSDGGDGPSADPEPTPEPKEGGSRGGPTHGGAPQPNVRSTPLPTPDETAEPTPVATPRSKEGSDPPAGDTPKPRVNPAPTPAPTPTPEPVAPTSSAETRERKSHGQVEDDAGDDDGSLDGALEAVVPPVDETDTGSPSPDLIQAEALPATPVPSDG